MSPMILAGVLFLIAYALIASDRLPKTTVALAGGLLMILTGLLDQHQAFAAIDWNVLFLLAGMMILANILARTGLFQWLAIRAAKLAKGDPRTLMALMCAITALTSAFLDNVTTVMLLAPVTLFIAATLGVSAVPFLIAEVLASNIGGTATLIGDPPNILIGSAAGLSFMDFLVHLSPVIVLILVVFLGLAPWIFPGIRVSPERREAVLAIDESTAIQDRRLLTLSLSVLGLTVVGFLLHQWLHLEAATIAMTGAVSLMILNREDPREVLRDVEWETLFFFVGLFMLVEGVVHVGLIRMLGEQALAVTGGNLTGATLLLLWMSGLLSGVIDNIPYTATLIPLIRQMGTEMPVGPLWWALALGACLGGNLTLIGASANVIVASMAEKAGQRITFGTFLKTGGVVTLLSLSISTVYLWVRYLR